MSLKAYTWATKFAPPMPPQHLATLVGLAEHADNDGRGSYPSVATLAAYTCKSERSVQRDIKALLDLGLIRLGDQSLALHLPAGKRPEVYDLALEKVVPGGRAGNDEATLASRVALASSRARGGKGKPKSDAFSTSGTGDAHVTPDAHVTGDAHVAHGVTPTSPEGRRPRHPNQNPEPATEPKDSLSPALPLMPTFDGAGRETDATKKQDHHLEAFGAFWLTYPKKKAREEAKKAWIAAIERGANPEHIVQAAAGYARERADQDPKYTKHPATWLNKGCYDDEPEPTGRPQLRAVSGEYRPWTNPTDQSAYYDSL